MELWRLYSFRHKSMVKTTVFLFVLSVLHSGRAWNLPHQTVCSRFLSTWSKASVQSLRPKSLHCCQTSGASESAFARKRVGVIGSGAVGLYYGARLIESGKDVSFLCRRDAAALKEKGLSVFSYEGDMYFPPDALKIYTKSEDMGVMDWVILALKSYSLPAAAALAR